MDFQQQLQRTGRQPAAGFQDQKWIHAWVANNHNSWGGCITDRVRTWTFQNGSVSASFPADNPRSSPTIPVSSSQCMPGIVTPLEIGLDGPGQQAGRHAGRRLDQSGDSVSRMAG